MPLDALALATHGDPEDDTVIASSLIKKPRKQRRCAVCHQLISGTQKRLFGRACAGDPPYVVYTHVDREECLRNLKASN